MKAIRNSNPGEKSKTMRHLNPGEKRRRRRKKG